MLCAFKSLFAISVLGYYLLTLQGLISTKIVQSKLSSRMPCPCRFGGPNDDFASVDIPAHCDCTALRHLQRVSKNSLQIRHNRRTKRNDDEEKTIPSYSMMQIFLSLQGINILNPDTSQVSISTEEQHRQNLSSNPKPIIFHAGALSTNQNSALKTELHLQPKFGLAVIRQLSNQTMSAPNPHKCDTLLHHIDTASIPFITNQHNFTQFPCNFTVNTENNHSIWTSAVLEYYPRFAYHGEDRFVINFVHGSIIRPIKVQIWILANACLNGGRCLGPADDKLCRSIQRAKGFQQFNYTCSCPTGYKGEYCEKKMSSHEICVHSICKLPKQCVLIDGSYKCICPKDLIYCEPFLESWQTALLVITTGVMICLITVGLIMIARKRNSQFWDTSLRF